ncbi:MAG: PfkB family carbohydrate kinase [Thermoprotei archaeon]|nr:PfkB family carbohydrate kinase [Thermoprotei archaeon]
MVSFAVVSSFTVDVVEVGGSSFERLGGPAYYAGLTLKGLGLDPVIVSSLGYEDKGLVSDVVESYGLDVAYVGGCSSVFKFHHVYVGGRRVSRLVGRGCKIDVSAAFEALKSADWVIVSPVFREVDPGSVAELSSHVNVAVDLQGYARVEGPEGLISSSAEALLESLKLLSNVHLAHLSSDDLEGSHGDSRDLGVLKSFNFKPHILSYTAGPGGGYMRLNTQWYHVPAYVESPLGDPTGCGDIYLAALAAYIARGLHPVRAAARASVAAGLRVSRGFPLSFNLGEIEEIAGKLEKTVTQLNVGF